MHTWRRLGAAPHPRRRRRPGTLAQPVERHKVVVPARDRHVQVDVHVNRPLRRPAVVDNQ